MAGSQLTCICSGAEEMWFGRLGDHTEGCSDGLWARCPISPDLSPVAEALWIVFKNSDDAPTALDSLPVEVSREVMLLKLIQSFAMGCPETTLVAALGRSVPAARNWYWNYESPCNNARAELCEHWDQLMAEHNMGG